MARSDVRGTRVIGLAQATSEPASPSSGMMPPDPGPLLSAGFSLGRYVILDLVGRGGMSEVYAAYDRTLDRRVALKVLYEMQPSGEAGMTTARARLLREAKAIARLSHPNVVVVYDAGEIDDRVFLAMEFIEGQTLAAWLAAAPRTWPEIRRVFADAGRGLAAAHQAGIIHRDFKPQNVMVGQDGVVRVMDFGLAGDKAMEEYGAGRGVPDAAALDTGPVTQTLVLTRYGELIGTPLYMAPEQFRAEAADGRTDQFGFCVALYEAVYGQRPFPSETPAVLRDAVTQGIVRSAPAGSRVASWLRRLILRGLAPDRNDRFPSMEALLAALDRDPTRVVRRLVPVAIVGLLLAGGGVYLRHAARRDGAMCRGASERVARIWEPASAGAGAAPRRAAVARAFAATGHARAVMIGERVDQLLDRYALDWTGMYTEACEATRVRGDQSEALLDLRMGCLQHRLTGLRALTDLFATADAAMLDNAVGAALSLQPIETCGDTNALRAAVPPPDPVVRARVEEVRQRLVEAKVLSDAGRLAEAKTRSRLLVSDARTIGYGALVAEAQLEHAFELFVSYDTEAENQTWKALVEGEANGQDEVVATSAVMLRSLLLDQGAFGDEGRLDQLAESALRRIGGHPRLWIWLLDDRTASLADAGRAAEALKSAQQVATLAEKSLGRDHRDFGAAMIAMALALGAGERWPEALVAIDQSLAVFHALYGPDNAFLAIPLVDRGEILSALGRDPEAHADFQRALDQATADHGPDHPIVAFALTGLGTSLLAEGRSREAIPLLERAVKLRTLHAGHSGYLQDSQFALARALWERGEGRDPRRAIALAREALRGYAVVPAPAYQARARKADEWLQASGRGG